MPKVPYAPYPTERLSDTGLPAVRAPVVEEAFGSATARGIGSLGRGLDKASDELFTRAVQLQQMQNKAEADQADALFMEETGRLHAEYASLRGQQAVAGFEPHIAAVREARQRTRETLTTPDSRRLYDSQTRGYLGREMARTAGHAATENRRWMIGASEARVQAEKDRAYAEPADSESFDRGLSLIEREVRSQAVIAGWGKEQADEEVKKQRSGMLSLRIAGLARTDPSGASALYEKYRGEMTAQDSDRTDKVVTTQSHTIESRIIADRVGAGREDVPLEKAIKDGERIAEHQRPNDPAFKDFVRQRIYTERNRIKAQKRERDFDNQEIIAGTIVGAKVRGDRLPTSLEELFALNPRAQDAWENTDATRQEVILKKLKDNALNPRKILTAERLRRWSEIKGLADSDVDSDREKFITMDILAEDLPNAEMKELFNLQQRKRRNPESNPLVRRALTHLGPMMESAGVLRNQNEKDFLAFRGALTDAIEIWQTENKGKALKTEDYMQLGSRVLEEIRDPEKFNFFGAVNRTSRMFKLTVPDIERDNIINAYKADNNGREPNEDEIARHFFIKQWLKLYGKKQQTP